MDGLIFKLFKFGLVGLLGMVIDFTVTFLLKEKVKINKYVANAIGFMCSATSNFTFNRLWTFQSHDPNVSTQYLEYIAIASIGLAINSLILWFLVSKKNFHFYLAKLIAIMVVILWNFTLNNLLVFA